MTRSFLISLACASLISASAWAQPAPIPVTVANGQPQTTRVVAAGSTNSTLVKGSAGAVFSVSIAVTQATDPVFVHLYNVATAPTCGTSVPVWTGSAAAVTGGGNSLTLAGMLGVTFPAGIGMCISKDYTGSVALTANDAVVSVVWR